jgi:sucrose-6-phosphate hydrolase SacC (GH32 family)
LRRNSKAKKDLLVVWFDAWKYEKEKHLTMLPFIRTISLELENKLALENNSNSKNKRWNHLRKGLQRTIIAFSNSSTMNLGLGEHGSAQIDLANFTNIFRADGSVVIDNVSIINM